tara:strand:- start:2114 stop:3424 length:1311 start_codon:yes stop_codon:yes gene_type:complete
MSNESTGTDIVPIHTASPEEIANFKLDSHLLGLMWDEPFFAHILRPVTKVKTDAISTAGVLAKEGAITMWWNPKFLASLGAKQVKGLLKHECYHLVFEHTTQRKHEPHIIWNYGTDCAINSVIPEDELPECGLIPGKAFPELTPEQIEKMGPDAVNRYTLISAKIESFPKEMSSEWYFARLMEDDDVREAIEGSEGDDFIITDNHDGWGEMSEEERELIKGKIRQALSDAAKQADSNNAWGSVPASMRAKIREMISKEVDWKTILRSAIGNKKRAGRDTSIRRLNRKYPGVHPGSRRKYTSSWAVYVDQSGSVDDESLSLLFGELASLARITSFDVYYFDTEVDEDSKFTWRRGARVDPKRTRCGGTCFSAPTKHANARGDKYDGHIILTDGYASDPGHSKMRRVWVITPNGSLQFDKGRDILVNMKRETKQEEAA